MLDAQARRPYRHRIEALRAEADDALASGQLETAEACQAELDQLVGQLAQAFGLGWQGPAGGVGRRAGPPERHPGAASGDRQADRRSARGRRVLDRRVRTGLYCAYDPADDDEVRWIVQS